MTVEDLTGVDGIDTVRNVERLQFTNETVNLATPSAPVIGTAVAGDAKATVNWTAGAPQGAAVAEFRIQVITGGNVVNTVTGIAPGATSAVVTGLTNDTSYTFRVLAVNTLGVLSPLSAASNAVVPTSPGPVVTGSTPVDGQTAFAVGANIVAQLQQARADARLAASTVRSSCATSRQAPTCCRTITPAAGPTQTITLNPPANLVAGNTFTVTLNPVGTAANAQIRDCSGNVLPTTVITFTAQADGVASDGDGYVLRPTPRPLWVSESTSGQPSRSR